jgi:SNF2 family DNA or RNA helicase
VDEDGQARRLSAIALLLHLLHLAQARPQPSRSRKPADPPPLVICADPAAWEAAVARAAPPLVPALHCGPERATSPAELKARAAGRGLVLTSYEELSIDADLLGAVEWPMILFDEADAWVSPSSGLRSAAQKLRARCRIGLAGAAIDRRLTSLWAALELVSPGLLGSLEAFQREIALPLERFRDAEAEALLARVVRLLVFRAAEPAPEAAADAPHAHPAEEVGG